MTAQRTLSRALDALAQAGRSWPCRGRQEWITDTLEDRATAEAECRGCPVLNLCAAATTELDPTAATWAGQSYGAPTNTPRGRKRKTTTTEGAA